MLCVAVDCTIRGIFSFFLSDHKVDFTSDQPDHRAPGSVSGPDRFAPTLLGHKKNCFGSEPLIKGTD